MYVRHKTHESASERCKYLTVPTDVYAKARQALTAPRSSPPFRYV